MSDADWAEVDEHLNTCLDAFYAALKAAREAREASIKAHKKAIEAADIAENIAKWNLKFERKKLLFQEDV